MITPLSPKSNKLNYQGRWAGIGLTNLIGEGGFGQVWKAYDPELDRLVAIKVLRRERHRSVFQVARFVDEAKKVAKLRHPNIVSVYDFGREGGYYYFVADLIAGDEPRRADGAGQASSLRSCEHRREGC